MPVLGAAALATGVLGIAAAGLRINPTLDRLRSVTDAARLEEQLAPMFGLPGEVYVVLAENADLEPLLQTNEKLTADDLERAAGLAMQPPTRLLPSQAAQERNGRADPRRPAVARRGPGVARARG